MTEEKKPDPVPWLLINPKISGQGVVLRKDGTVSVPPQETEKELDHGRNPGN
jgi:hypothetical protein